jgi:hypothetical protein
MNINKISFALVERQGQQNANSKGRKQPEKQFYKKKKKFKKMCVLLVHFSQKQIQLCSQVG